MLGSQSVCLTVSIIVAKKGNVHVLTAVTDRDREQCHLTCLPLLVGIRRYFSDEMVSLNLTMLNIKLQIFIFGCIVSPSSSLLQIAKPCQFFFSKEKSYRLVTARGPRSLSSHFQGNVAYYEDGVGRLTAPINMKNEEPFGMKHNEARIAAMESRKGDGMILSTERRSFFLSSTFFLLTFFVANTITLSRALAATKHSSTTFQPSNLGVRNLFLAMLMLITLAIIPLTRFSASLSKSLFMSASRCAVQVFLLGSVILQRIMGSSNPWLVATWIVGVGYVAGKEAFSRIKHTYFGLKNEVYSSVLIGGLSVLGSTVLLGIFGNDFFPWFQPRIWIPVSGMLFGNTLTASALAASTLTSLFENNRDAVEIRLARGATSREAVMPLVQETLVTSLTPTMNSLAVTGIVHIPGMMTGQILAGASASQAASYQIIISILIATTACTTVQLLVNSILNSLVDFRQHRLNYDTLSSNIQLPSNPSSNIFATFCRHSYPTWILRYLSRWKRLITGQHQKQLVKEDKKSEKQFRSLVTSRCNPLLTSGKHMSTEDVESPVIDIKNLHISRVNATLSLVAERGDRIGISGRSGVGKSQVLRTIAGLETCEAGEIWLEGFQSDNFSLPEFRVKVCFVPQNRPYLEGTPNMFYEAITGFDYQQRRQESTIEETKHNSPMYIAEQWGVEKECFNKQWSVLSGGEVQRISLAIALALKPEVLLLDESTNSLDEETCRMVEETLIERKIPIIIVTHSKEQLDRFCTDELNL